MPLGRLWRHRDSATMYVEIRAQVSRHPQFPFKEAFDGGGRVPIRCFILRGDGKIVNPETNQVEGEVKWYRQHSSGVILVRALKAY